MNKTEQKKTDTPAPAVGATVQIVIDSLFARIKAGEFPVDTRLPSERTLASELGVARNTVREALDVLESQNVIRRRAGSGSFVIYQNDSPPEEDTAGSLAEETSPLDYLVIRGIVEPEMVRLAVINMRPREINELGETLSKLEAVTTDAKEFAKYETEIYNKIAVGTRNPLLASIYSLILEASHQRFHKALLQRHLTPLRIEQYQQRYNTLFNAIVSRDVESAVELIKLHLVDEQKTLLQDD